MSTGKTIAVTGGAGFIGSHLCDFLLARGNKVICIDNLSTGRKENIRHLEKNPAFTFVEHDIVTPFFTEEHIDQIYNLACPASPVQYQSNAIHTIKTNTVGVINMLGLARAHKARILQASTSEVYGDPLEHPQKETYWGNVNPVGIRSCYDESKRVAETLAMDFNRQFGVRIKIARIFNTYGPNMDPKDGRVVSNFIVQALKNLPLTVYGDGRQTRSFQYVDDLVEGLIKLIGSGDNFTGPVNLGNPGEFTVNELAEKIIKMTGSQSKITNLPLPQDDPKKRQPDITLAKRELLWESKVKLDEGLAKTIEYFKQI